VETPGRTRHRHGRQRDPRDLMETPLPPGTPLSSAELLHVLRSRWQASYDLQLVQRRGRIYLQVMWAYLEQQSFPLSAEAYAERLETLVAGVNELGAADQVRHWLGTTRDRPRLGRAMTLALELPEGRASEFIL
jgi:hypothetical protein